MPATYHAARDGYTRDDGADRAGATTQADSADWELGADFYTLRFRRSRGAFVSAEA